MASELQTVIGVFESQDQVNCAEQSLKSAGFHDEDIGVAMRGQPGTVVGDRGTKATEGTATGIVAGGVVGGLLGAAASLLVPGVGPILAGGMLATALAGAATGAVAGGVLGALVGLGIPEEQARYYNDQFQAGRIIVTARAHGNYDKVYSILRDCGAYDMETRPATGAPVSNDRVIRLHDEPADGDHTADETYIDDDDLEDTRDTGRDVN